MSQPDKGKSLRRQSTTGVYDSAYAMRNTMKDVPRVKPKGENVANDEDREKKALVPSQSVDTMRARRNISNFLDRGNYPRLARVDRDKFKPSGIPPGLKSLREQKYEKNMKARSKGNTMLPKREMTWGERFKGGKKRKRRRTKKRKRRRTKKKRKRRRKKRRRTRK